MRTPRFFGCGYREGGMADVFSVPATRLYKNPSSILAITRCPYRAIGYACPRRAAGVEVIDLAIVYGLPSFDRVLDAVLCEVIVEKAVMANETDVHNPAQAKRIRSHFGDVALVTHEDLKAMASEARFVVRSGDATPYSNILLAAGVAFT